MPTHTRPNMTKVLKRKVGGVSFAELFGAGISKVGTEAILARTPVGNANLISGGLKLLLAAGVGQYLGQGYLPRVIALGMGVDGFEDIVHGIGLGGYVSGRVTPQQGGNW